jgi:hypothetical protein
VNKFRGLSAFGARHYMMVPSINVQVVIIGFMSAANEIVYFARSPQRVLFMYVNRLLNRKQQINSPIHFASYIVASGN